MTAFLRDVRPPANPAFEVRYETGPGYQGQVDFAQFQWCSPTRCTPWGEVFDDPVVATALLDRLLHHAVVV